jgi:effector-binding domain-containing protein
MLEPQTVQIEPMTVAYLEMRGAYSQVPAGFATLYQWLATMGLTPAGMPQAVYNPNPAEVPEAESRWELWAPVAPEAAPRATDGQGCGVKVVPARTVARAVHKGPYDAIDETYAALWSWVAEHGHEVIGPPEEAYLTDPNEAPPEEYLTQISFPIRTP